METQSDKPVLIYDGDCDFCKRWIAGWRMMTADRIDYAPYQERAQRYPDIPLEQFKRSVQLIEPDGRVLSAAAAVVRTLRDVPGKRWMWWTYGKVPGAAPIMEVGYRIVARHRHGIGKLTTLLWGKDVRPASYLLSRWLFLRLLGLVFLIAIVSLWTQVGGLIGSAGILPASEYLERTPNGLGVGAYWLYPTLCWFSASDAMLYGLCAAGTVLAALLIIGVAPKLTLLLLWVTYLSLTIVGQVFLSFQWDILLLETAFVAMFWAPWQLWRRPSLERPASHSGLWLLRFLLFKLIFLSGVTKLLSGDPTWHALTALQFHYETQPLPTWIGWYAHQLPGWWQNSSVLIMFIIEIVVPFLIFAPRRLRHLGCAILVLYQVLIAASGNYGFFNLLILVLCVCLLDDQFLRRLAPKRWTAWLDTARSWPLVPLSGRVTMWLLAAFVLLASTVALFDEMVRTMRSQQRAMKAGAGVEPLPDKVVTVLDASDRFLLSWGKPAFLEWIRPLRTINGYGLFRSMTTQRIEIAIEGSDDGTTWREYKFRWKPGNVKSQPRFVVPHQPRLDWQMWFAPLNLRANAYWLERLMRRLLEGSPDVLKLFADNPFPDQPPRFIRLVFYRYHFTDLDTKRTTGAWWRREHVRTSPPMTAPAPVIQQVVHVYPTSLKCLSNTSRPTRDCS